MRDFEQGNVRTRQYWDVPVGQHDALSELGRNPSGAQIADRFLDLLEESVRLRLMADVPLGMFLSGGIDSSAIAAVMSGMIDAPIQAFSVAFAEREANELDYARLVARTLKIDLHEVVVTPEAFLAALPKLIWHEDEPLAHPSSVALYFVSELASRHVKVVLTGEGSDELLAGYERYRKTLYNLWLGARYHRWTGAAARLAIQRGIERLPGPSRLRRKLIRTFLCVPPDIESSYGDNFAVFPRAMQRGLLTPEALERAGGCDPYDAMRRGLEAG